MSAATASPIGSDNAIEAIQGKIRKRTWGRIDLLRVEMADGRILVRGLAQSYYDKQLVIQAVLEATHGDPEVPIAMDIRVLDRDRANRFDVSEAATGFDS